MTILVWPVIKAASAGLCFQAERLTLLALSQSLSLQHPTRLAVFCSVGAGFISFLFSLYFENAIDPLKIKTAYFLMATQHQYGVFGENSISLKPVASSISIISALPNLCSSRFPNRSIASFLH